MNRVDLIIGSVAAALAAAGLLTIVAGLVELVEWLARP
jgi:hypothetical protein